MENNKTRVIKYYEKLSDELKEQIKLVFQEGYSQHLIEFKNAQRETVSALPFETFDKKYMIRMSIKKANQLIEHDPDFDKSGNLKEDARKKYEDEYSDIEYFPENETYDYDGFVGSD